MYLVDTNVLSEFMKRHPDPHVDAFLSAKQREGAQVFVSVLTFGEMRRGVLKLQYNQDFAQSALMAQRLQTLKEQYCDDTVGVGDATSEIWARLSVPSPHSPIDKLIAATAVERQLTVLTRNVRDFQHAELKVINPFDDTDALCRGITYGRLSGRSPGRPKACPRLQSNRRSIHGKNHVEYHRRG
ncbi:type II toxin-antitoxin system VapC family toxin [Cupriavidus pampae]|uniref:Ribonuclease VapC n=1 Tax=Cupriavidus pampae TaxID=659251 RepID=A0ABM8WUH4_9BURK|nr:type II toxin-antitoxin system VapC family toxin [Cupriavidus pampae]CAG9171130.1 tRNA(fMet)-specific endonuclease VapC [Cupriavidus pampae]